MQEERRCTPPDRARLEDAAVAAEPGVSLSMGARCENDSDCLPGNTCEMTQGGSQFCVPQ